MADGLKLVSGGDDVKIWEWPGLRLLHTLQPHSPHSSPVSSLAWSPNSIFFMITTYGKVIIIVIIVNCLTLLASFLYQIDGSFYCLLRV